MDPKCKQMITKRQITQNTGLGQEARGAGCTWLTPPPSCSSSSHPPPPLYPDFRLNPVLRKACRPDIPKFCQGLLSKASEDGELEGQVIACLKLKYADQVSPSRHGEDQR